MRLLRDVSGTELVRVLERHGYEITRQRGSHLRLTRERGEPHQFTIPAHANLRVGALSAILSGNVERRS